MINFTTINEHLRFEINVDSVKKSGFIISPQLLKLAIIVKSKEED